MDCYCDYDPATVYRASRHTARKQYRCEECRREIKPGEKYEYVFAVWDGSASHVRTCSHCITARQWVKNNVPCLCWSHSNMLNDCGMAVLDAQSRAPEETRGLLFGYYRRLVAIQKAGGRPPRRWQRFQEGP